MKGAEDRCHNMGDSQESLYFPLLQADILDILSSYSLYFLANEKQQLHL